MELLSALAPANHSNDSGNPADGTGWYLFTTLNGNKVTIWTVLISILNVTVVVFILWLNGLVLDTMIRQKKSQEPADLLLAGLALTDVLVGLTTLWITIYNLLFFQNMYECLVRLGMVHSVMIVGMLHLLCLTLDRFLRITQPYRYESLCGRRTMYIVLAAVWIGGIQLGLLPTFGWNLYKEVASSPGKPVCTYFRIMDASYIGFYAVFVLAVIVLMWLIYTRLFFVARKHIHAMAFLQTRTSAPISLSTDQRQKSSTGSGSGSFRSRFMSDHAWRYTRTVVLIVGVNCVGWLPTGIVVVLSVTGTLDYLDDVDKGSLLMYVSTLVYCNGIINPLIYGTQISAIRYRFCRVFCQRRTMSRQGTDRSTGLFHSTPHAFSSFGWP